MKKRIDHAEEAQNLIEVMQRLESEQVGTTAMAAQVHATLALVEQQRIANQLFANAHRGSSHLSDADYFAVYGKEKPSGAQIF